MEHCDFDLFLEVVAPHSKEFAAALHTYLSEQGFSCEMKNAKSGYTVSYHNSGNGKTLATFVCRKSGVKLRILPQYLSRYEAFLDTLPESMKKEIRKASVCKRLINPEDCNSRCVKGYDFSMDAEHFQKCRSMAFMHSLCQEHNPYIRKFLELEISFH